MAKKKSQPKLTEKELLDRLTINLINRVWFSYASRLVNEVAKICELSPEQKDVLEYIHLKPNDFDIKIIK